jgi:transcription initiation factor TFIID subunit 6
MIPPVLTCLVGRSLGSGIDSLDHYDLRDLAASLLGYLCAKYSRYSHNLKPRIARSCLKTFLDPKRPFGSHYGAILGLKAVGGPEVVRQLILPNLKAYGDLLQEDMQDPGKKHDEVNRVVRAIIDALGTMVDEHLPMMNGHTDASANEMRTRLVDSVGEVIGSRIADSGHTRLAKAVLEGDISGL